jgi:hypothetical protein
MAMAWALWNPSEPYRMSVERNIDPGGLELARIIFERDNIGKW